ncbi:MAG: hypothetical protein ABFD96_25075 [Armatimonadia bacterium]
MAQAALRQASWDEILACPLFREGYDDVWRGDGPAVDLRWSDEEQLSYERGRQFGVYILTEERARVPLMKGALPSPRAKLLLMIAMRSGDVL